MLQSLYIRAIFIKISEELPISRGHFLNEKNFTKIIKSWCYLLAGIKT